MLVGWAGEAIRCHDRQRPEALSTTDAEAISVPPLDPAQCPSPLVSCRQPCPQATRAEGGGRTDDTCRRVSACRHGVNNCRQDPEAPPSPTRAAPPPAVCSRLPGA